MRAGVLREADLPAGRSRVLGATHSARIGRMVKDVVVETRAAGLAEIRDERRRCSRRLLDLRAFLFASVYENELSTAEFKKAAGILGGLWEKVRERPDEFLDARTVEPRGWTRRRGTSWPGMTDRYAVALFEHLFIPKPWIEAGRPWVERIE